MSELAERAGGTAVIFPGMGASGFADLGRFLVLDRYVRPRLRVADEVLGGSLLAMLRAADGSYTVPAQVAFLVASLALADRAEHELGMRPDVCVGPSFGHRALTAYAEALGFAEAIRFTTAVAECELAYFADAADDPVTQCYVRVPDEPLRELLDSYRADGAWVEISGYLDRGGYLVSVSGARLAELTSAVRALGGYAMQTMRPPAHAARFGGLRDLAARTVLAGYRLAEPTLPVVADQDGRTVHTAEDLRTMLLDGFDRPLDWPATVRGLVALGVRTAYVTGPDQLFHRLDCTTANLRVVPVTPKTAGRPRPVERG